MGAGILSATLAVLLKELLPDLNIFIFEKLGSAAQESSNAWNNAGTGRAALGELNYTPQRSDGSIRCKDDMRESLSGRTEIPMWKQEGISGGELAQAESLLFKETPAHSWFDLHNDPIPQYVITLAGVLEFCNGWRETFTIHPGDVLLAEDHTGSGISGL